MLLGKKVSCKALIVPTDIRPEIETGRGELDRHDVAKNLGDMLELLSVEGPVRDDVLFIAPRRHAGILHRNR